MLVGRWWWWWKSGARPLKVLELSAVAHLLPSISVACCHPMIFLVILSLPNLLTFCHLQVTIPLGTWLVPCVHRTRELLPIFLISCPVSWLLPCDQSVSESEVAWESCWVDAHLWPSAQTAEGEIVWFLFSNGACIILYSSKHAKQQNLDILQTWYSI